MYAVCLRVQRVKLPSNKKGLVFYYHKHRYAANLTFPDRCFRGPKPPRKEPKGTLTGGHTGGVTCLACDDSMGDSDAQVGRLGGSCGSSRVPRHSENDARAKLARV